MTSNRRLAVFSVTLATPAVAALVVAGCGTSDLVLPRDEPDDGGSLQDVATLPDTATSDALGDAADGGGAVDSSDAAEAGESSVGQVTAGRGFACVVRSGCSVWCWGSNQYGELGSMPS